MGPLLNAAFEFIERTGIGLVKVGKHFFTLDSLNSEKTLTGRLYFQLTPHRYLARDGYPRSWQRPGFQEQSFVRPTDSRSGEQKIQPAHQSRLTGAEV
jgi:hypothetical protein